MTRELALDLLLRGVFTLAQRMRQQDPQLRQAVEHNVHAPLYTPWANLSPEQFTVEKLAERLDGFALLDELARLNIDTQFPYPGSPRLDGTGGARRIAPDGSPGIPASWVRWMMQPKVYNEARDGAAANAPLLLAIAWLMHVEPGLWRTYAQRVLEENSVGALARAERVSPSTIYARLARARVLLLAQVAYFTGTTDAAEYESLMFLIRNSAASEA